MDGYLCVKGGVWFGEGKVRGGGVIFGTHKIRSERMIWFMMTYRDNLIRVVSICTVSIVWHSTHATHGEVCQAESR